MQRFQAEDKAWNRMGVWAPGALLYVPYKYVSSPPSSAWDMLVPRGGQPGTLVMHCPDCCICLLVPQITVLITEPPS